jgi:hypothetical protein
MELLSSTLLSRPTELQTALSMSYSIDLQPGIYSVRQILNICCLADPARAFETGPFTTDGMSGLYLEERDFSSSNPLAPPRALAVKFFETEIGKPTNSIPSAAEVSRAMADSNPRKRWAARAYFGATQANYRWGDLISKSDGPENTVWTALGIGMVFLKTVADPRFYANLGSAVTNDFSKVKDPGLALVLSLALAKNGQDLTNIDTIVSQHKFTQAEIDGIKSDVYRLAHESPPALEKLKTLNLDVPEFSAKALVELADTNVLTLVRSDQK